VIEKLSYLVILAILTTACAVGPSSTTPQRADTAAAPESLPTSTPTEPTVAEDATEPDSDSDSDSDSEEGSGTAQGPAPSESGDDVDPAKKKSSKSERIVLKTAYDDQRVGEDQDDSIEAELGLVKDEKLLQYVRSIGIRLVRHAPPQPFDYEFKIVDQTVPNAFALPGGKIYVSRGLLALVQSEDELAGVIGHEITHAAERHAAARIDYSSRINPFSMGLMRAASIAAYGRDQERDADRGGQILAARAGYNPNGISTFLRKLDASDRYEIGWSRLPYFLATHPTNPERSVLASERAARLTWERQPGIADDLPSGYFSVIDGLILGDNPAGGLFEGSLFVHPDLRFSIRFPRGWTTINSQQAVGAISPMRDAQAMLTVEGDDSDIAKVVDDFIEKEVDGTRIKVRDRREIKLGDLPAIRIEGTASNGLSVQMTFVAYEGLVYRLSLMSLSGAASKYRGRGRAFAHSFHPIDDEEVYSLQITRLRIARALKNETLQELSARTHNELELVYTGVMNDLYASVPLAKGTPVKIGLDEPYLPEAKKDSADETEAKPESESEPAPEPALKIR
jgi:predicted Zn-dependent protease